MQGIDSRRYCVVKKMLRKEWLTSHSCGEKNCSVERYEGVLLEIIDFFLEILCAFWGCLNRHDKDIGNLIYQCISKFVDG